MYKEILTTIAILSAYIPSGNIEINQDNSQELLEYTEQDGNKIYYQYSNYSSQYYAVESKTYYTIKSKNYYKLEMLRINANLSIYQLENLEFYGAIETSNSIKWTSFIECYTCETTKNEEIKNIWNINSKQNQFSEFIQIWQNDRYMEEEIISDVATPQATIAATGDSWSGNVTINSEPNSTLYIWNSIYMQTQETPIQAKVYTQGTWTALTFTQNQPTYTTEVIDIPSMILFILTAPFTFISQAFNITLFAGTQYQINVSYIFMAVITAGILILVIKTLMGK